MLPFNFGGEMISEVRMDDTKFKDPPYKFEAGTPAIAQVIALKHAIYYIQKIGISNIGAHEKELTNYSFIKLKEKLGNSISVLGPQNNIRAGIISFNFKNYHPHDIAQILDEDNICVRAGHHCAMPLHRRLGVSSSVRMSFYLYNDRSDIDKLINGLKNVEKILK